MKNILLLVHDDIGQEARLQAALDLTRAVSGHLSCLDVTPLPVLADSMAWGMAVAPAAVLRNEATQEGGNKARLEQRLKTEDVAWSWKDICGEFPVCVADAARTADIVVLNTKLHDAFVPDMVDIIGDVLKHQDVLILAVDETARQFDPFGTAMIAWNGSEEAMSSVQHAVPLLRPAASVTIFQVGELTDDAISAEEVASYLSRHGVGTEIQVSRAQEKVSDQISSAAARLGVSFCVMGAYGHGRLREVLFGGVTRDMLEGARVPLVIGR